MMMQWENPLCVDMTDYLKTQPKLLSARTKGGLSFLAAFQKAHNHKAKLKAKEEKYQEVLSTIPKAQQEDKG